MGFRAKKKVYKLVFEGDLEGLEVRARSLPLGAFMGVLEAFESLPAGAGARDLSGAQAAKVASLFSDFAGVLVSWNLEYDDDHELAGEPVPATLEGLYEQDLGFVLQIVEAWMDAVGGVSGPLADRSTAGSPALAESIPMEPLSASQAS